MRTRRLQREEEDHPVRELKPGSISAFELQRHTPGRYSVFLDGEFAFGIQKDLLLRSGLGIGDALSIDAIESLIEQDRTSRAVESAIRLLAQRPRSEREIRTRLRQKGFEPLAIDQAISRLRELRYLDDREFSRLWVENRLTHRPRGKRLLEQELREKGIDRETAQAALEETPFDETAAAIELGRQRLRSYHGLSVDVQRTRLVGFLSRKGFTYDTIKRALDQILGENDEVESE